MFTPFHSHHPLILLKLFTNSLTFFSFLFMGHWFSLGLAYVWWGYSHWQGNLPWATPLSKIPLLCPSSLYPSIVLQQRLSIISSSLIHCGIYRRIHSCVGLVLEAIAGVCSRALPSLEDFCPPPTTFTPFLLLISWFQPPEISVSCITQH